MIRARLLLLVLLLLPTVAHATPSDRGRQLTKKANALYSSGKYLAASAAFEEAYSERAEAALLFNAAQSARLGGDLRRAQTLYSSYVSFHPDGPNLGESKQQLAVIEEKLRADAIVNKPADPPPVTIVVTNPPPKPEQPKTRTPVYKRWWLWAAVVVGAGAVAAGVTLGIVLTRPAPVWTNVADLGPGAPAKTSALVQLHF